MREGNSRVGRNPDVLAVKRKHKKALRKIVNSGKSPQALVQRAQVVLLSSEGKSAQQIGQRLGISMNTVYKWRKRFKRCAMEGLTDLPRSGHPVTFSPLQRTIIISTACELSSGKNGLNGRTLKLIKEQVIAQGLVKDISTSTICRILNEADIKPHKIRMWMHSQDPQFKEKANEIIELYLSDKLTVCIDEKTGMQAIERFYPDTPAAQGRQIRREFNYIRHGTQALIAGFDVRTGKVIARCGKTRKAKDLLAFMNMVAKEHPDKQIHIVWDNLNIHNGERWEKFNKKHGNRFQFHYTPLHASWVNQIEIWFGILARMCLRHGNFKSIKDLKMQVLAFIKYWNEKRAHPFRWTFKGYPLQR